MKRSGSEGRWADVTSARIRFAAEAVFLILVAAGAALTELNWRWILLLMFFAWLLVALIERSASRGAPVARAQRAVEPEAETSAEPKPSHADRWLRRRRLRAAIEPLVAPTAPLEERPSRSHVRRIEAEAPPQVESPAELEMVEPEPTPPGAAVTEQPLDLPGLEKPEPVPEPVRAASPSPEPPAYQPPPVPWPPAREWNLWDLERLAREQAGDAVRDEEWTALFVHLREFASADGVLPKEFDGLVRESFSQLVQTA